MSALVVDYQAVLDIKIQVIEILSSLALVCFKRDFKFLDDLKTYLQDDFLSMQRITAWGVIEAMQTSDICKVCPF